MTLEEHIRALWEHAFSGCDAITYASPRNYSLAFFRAGYEAGLKDGQQIQVEVAPEIKQQQVAEWDIGHLQGVSYAAWLASNCSLPNPDQSPGEKAAAREMRLIIVAAIEGAARAGKMRVDR